MTSCTRNNCPRPHYARGLCEAHYSRVRYGRDLDKPIMIVGDDTKRFFLYVKKTDGCWLWAGSKMGKGYGKFVAAGKQSSAHRFSYELHKKKIAPGMQLDHLCRVKLCVNPDHLEEVTNRENQLRAVRARIKS